jgi:hypothetical protein
VFFWKGANFEIPRLLEIWRDPKTNSTMYRKDMLKDWNFPHLLDCGWYLDCPNEITPPLEFEIWDKYEHAFLQGLGALKKETPTKKIIEGVRRKGRK